MKPRNHVVLALIKSRKGQIKHGEAHKKSRNRVRRRKDSQDLVTAIKKGLGEYTQPFFVCTQVVFELP